jgi:hypothetical protein
MLCLLLLIFRSQVKRKIKTWCDLEQEKDTKNEYLSLLGCYTVLTGK